MLSTCWCCRWPQVFRAAFLTPTIFNIQGNKFNIQCLFINRSQNTSNCVTKISDTLGYCLVCHFFVQTTFWRHLWSVTEQTHENMESSCLITCMPPTSLTFFNPMLGDSHIKKTGVLVKTFKEVPLRTNSSTAVILARHRFSFFTECVEEHLSIGSFFLDIFSILKSLIYAMLCERPICHFWTNINFPFFGSQ